MHLGGRRAHVLAPLQEGGIYDSSLVGHVGTTFFVPTALELEQLIQLPQSQDGQVDTLHEVRRN